MDFCTHTTENWFEVSTAGVHDFKYSALQLNENENLISSTYLVSVPPYIIGLKWNLYNLEFRLFAIQPWKVFLKPFTLWLPMSGQSVYVHNA